MSSKDVSPRAHEYHTFLFWPPLKTASPSENITLHYDVCGNDVVGLQKSNIVHFSPLVTASGRTFNVLNTEGSSYVLPFPVDAPPGTSFKMARRSLDRNYVVTIINQTDVVLYDVRDTESSPLCEVISCKQSSLRPRKDNFHVMDVVWLSTDSFLIVCSSYMDTYRVLPPGPPGSNRRARTTFIKRVNTTVDMFHYFPQHSLIMVVNKDKREAIKPYIVVHPDCTLKALDKLSIAAENAAEHTSSIPGHSEFIPLDAARNPKMYLRIITLYGVTFAVVVTPRQELLLFFFNMDELIFDRLLSVNIYDEGSVGINVIDNLLVVHNLSKKLTFVYDIRTKLRNGSTLHPLCLPLEIRPVRVGAKGLEDVEDESTMVGIFNPKSTEFHNTAHGPIIIDKANGKVYSVGINLPAVSRSLQVSTSLEFLMRRSSSVPYILGILQNMVIDPVYALTNIAAAFTMINVPYSEFFRRKTITRMTHSPTAAAHRLHHRAISANALGIKVFPPPPPSIPIDTVPLPMSVTTDHDVHATNRYLQIVDQLEVYKSVFHPFVDEPRVKRSHLIAVVIEYVYSLAQQNITLHELIQRFLIDLFIDAKDVNPPFHILHQLLMFRVIEDSEPVAMQLLKLETLYPPAFQLALDMLVRVKAFTTIVHVLVSRKMIVRAMEMILHNQITNVPLGMFFESIPNDVESNSLFVAVYELAMKYNRTVRGVDDHSFLDSDKCDAVKLKYMSLASHPSFVSPLTSPRSRLVPQS
eukprot:PhF_6_TR34162/c0_g1_i2/m.49960